MFIPLWLVAIASAIFGLAAWSFLLATERNPFPFPDRGSRIFFRRIRRCFTEASAAGMHGIHA